MHLASIGIVRQSHSKTKIAPGTFFLFSDSLLVASHPNPQNIYKENIEMANNTRRIHIRVTDEGYAELLRQKEFMKLPSYSDLIRMYINNNICFSVDFNGLYEVYTQISKIGNNINQIANGLKILRIQKVPRKRNYIVS